MAGPQIIFDHFFKSNLTHQQNIAFLCAILMDDLTKTKWGQIRDDEWIWKKNVVCCNTTALNFNNFNRKYTLYLLHNLCWGAMMNFILFSTSQYARILQKCNLGKAHSLSGWSLKSILFWICKKWLDFQRQRCWLCTIIRHLKI